MIERIATAVLFVALTVPGFVLAVRALPAVDRRVLAGKKPWACDICMCFWSTACWTMGAVVLAGDPAVALAAGPAYTISLLVLSWMSKPPTGEYPGPPEEPPP